MTTILHKWYKTWQFCIILCDIATYLHCACSTQYWQHTPSIQ